MWGTSSALKKTVVAKLVYPEEVWPKSLLIASLLQVGINCSGAKLGNATRVTFDRLRTGDREFETKWSWGPKVLRVSIPQNTSTGTTLRLSGVNFDNEPRDLFIQLVLQNNPVLRCPPRS